MASAKNIIKIIKFSETTTEIRQTSSSGEFRKVRVVPPLHSTSSWKDVELIRHRKALYFNFIPPEIKFSE
jgi:hypothetical protein